MHISVCILTIRAAVKLLCVRPLSEQQAQRCLAQHLLGGGLWGGEELLVVLRDEFGVNVPRLKLWVPRQTQEEVYVCVQTHDLRGRETQGDRAIR